MKERISNIINDGKRGDEIVALLFVVVAIASFALGRLSLGEGKDSGMVVYSAVPQHSQTPVPSDKKEAAPSVQPVLAASPKSTQQAPVKESEPLLAAVPGPGQYVASKTGSAYHLPWCSGAKRIKEENKIWFSTKEEAERAGYKPAGNCKGI